MTVASAGNPPFLEAAYREINLDLRVRASKIACILILICMPAGVLLEQYFYPEFIGRIFRQRLLCDLFVAAALAAHYTQLGRRFASPLSIISGLLPAASIAWMIFITDGGQSQYYAGLMLLVTGACTIMVWTFRDASIYSSILMAMYLAACIGNGSRPRVSPGGAFFLLTTIVICVTGCYYMARRRFAEFCLRYELDIKNKAIAESYERLSEMDRMKSQFFANVSHELRTPLTLILSPVEELLRRGSAMPESAVEPLRIVRQNALRLLKLITDLLEIIRLEEGRTQLKRQPVDLACFLPGIVDSVRHLATSKGLALASAGEGELVVEADPERLEKVVLNILTNAIKFTPAGGMIKTNWWRNDGRAVAEIADSGVGISEKELPFIFDRFHQGDGSSTRKFQGMGIGLALARDLVQQHGGTLTARSEMGKGTTLRIELPLAPAGTARPQRAPSTEAEPDPVARMYREADRVALGSSQVAEQDLTPVGSGAFTVLIVDDEPDMRRFLATTLASDYRVLQADDGELGLAAVRQHHPDLVLLDLMLPKIDGLEVCKAVKSDPDTAATRIILLTARTDEQSRLTALEQGADDFLTKPFSTIEVRTRLANLLRSARLEQDLRIRNRELEEAMAKLKATEAQLIQSEKMSALGKLSAGLLHEINNPLNFTLTAAEIAMGRIDGSDPDLKEMLGDIRQGMSRIRDIVTDLRTFAHPVNVGRSERFRLTDAVTSALRLAASELKDVRIERGDGIDREVCGAKTQIIHVLMNVLVNSAHATRAIATQRAPHIRLWAEPLGPRLRVHVRDNGSGIKATDLPRVFEPFFTTKDVGQGMGLGLSTCYTIIANHGGSITIESQEGQWTEVVFELPLAEEEHVDEQRLRLQEVRDPVRG